MATIAKLVLRIEAETRVLQNQLREASSAVTKFSADMNRSFSKLPNFDKLTLGGASVKPKLDAIERDFDRTFTKLRNSAKKGVIDPTAFADQLRTAVQTAKSETISLVGQLQAAGQITGRQAKGAIARAEQNAIKAETSILIGEAQSSLSRLENQFRATQATLTTTRAKGGLGTHEFAALGAKAEAEFNQAWDKEMQRFSKDPRFTEPMRQAFAQQFKRGGFGFDPRSEVVARSVDAARSGSAAFVQTYQKTVQSAKFGNLTGDLTGKQFKKALADANKELSNGLKTVRADLEKQGLVTPEALKFLNSQFQRGGEAAAHGFFEAFDKAMSSSSIASMQRLGTVATQVGSSLTKFLTLPLAGAGVGVVKLAGDAQQAEARLQQVFGVRSVELGRQLDALRLKIPATSSELKTMAARLGELFIPLGIAPAKVEEMSVAMVEAAKNIAIFSGVSTDRAFGAIINGLVGQSRELKKLGIEIDDRTIRDEAYRQGIARVGAQLSTTQKVIAGYSVILQRTGLIANSVAAQQNTFNVQLLFLVARLKEAGIALGTVLLPMLTRAANSFASIAEAFSELSVPMRAAILIFGGVAAAIGPALIAFGLFIRSITFVQASILALGELTGIEGGIAAILGVTVTAVGLIGLATGAIIALAAAWDQYTDSLGDFKGLSREARQEMQGMTKEQLRNVLVIQKANQDRIKAEMETLRKQAGIETTHIPLPGGVAGPEIVRGGNVAQRKQFIALQEDAKRVAATWEFANKQLDQTIDLENQLGDREKELQKRVKATQDAARDKLLVEQLQASKIALQDLNRAAADAKKNLTAGIRLKDADLVTRSIEQARDAISALEAEAKTLHAQSILPDNGAIREKLQGLERDAVASANSLRGFLSTAEKDKSLQDFAARLAEIKALLAAGFATGNIESISKAFGNITSLTEELTKAMDEAKSRGDQAGSARFDAMIQSLVKLKAQAEKSLLIPTAFFNQIDAAIAKLDLLKEAAPEGGIVTSTGIRLEDMDKAAELTRKLSDQLVELASEYVGLKVEADRTGADLSKLMEDNLKKQIEVNKKINEFRPNKFEELFPDMLPQLQRIAGAIRVAQDQMENARLFGDTAAAEKGHLALVRAESDLGKLRQSLIDTMRAAGASETVIQQVLTGFAATYKKAGGQAGDFAEKVDRGTRRLLKMSAVVGIIRQLAEAFGLTGSEIDKAVSSLGVLISGVEQFRKVQSDINQRRQAEAAKKGVDASAIPLNATEILGEISAAVAIVSSAFNAAVSITNAILGQGEAVRESVRITQENNKRLEELRLSIDNFEPTAGASVAARTALGSPGVVSAAEAFNTGFALERLGLQQSGVALADFNRSLAGTGLTLARLNAIAKANGIQLLDEKGRIVVGALAQLREALGITTANFFKWADTLDEMTKKTDLFNNVFNVSDTGQQQVSDQLSFLEQLAPDLFKQFFSGVDLTDMTAVEAALQALTQALLDGSLEATDALKLLDKDELIQIITGAADGLDKLRDASDSLTSSMLNVPTWFKRAQVVFESAAAQVTSATRPVEPPPVTKTPVQGGVDNPKPPITKRPSVESVDTNNFAATKMTADSLTVSKLDMPPIGPVSVTVPDIPAVQVNVAPIPPVTAELIVPRLAPVTLALPDIPPLNVVVPPVRVEVPEIPTLKVAVPDLPVLTVRVPDIPPIEVTVADIPPIAVVVPDIPPMALTVPQIPPIRAEVGDIPPVVVDVPVIPPLQVSLPTIPPLVVPPIPPVALTIPEIPTLTLKVPDIPAVAITIPDIPPVSVRVEDIPPVSLTVPPIDPVPVSLVVPDLPPVALTLPDIPPLTVTVPEIPPVQVDVPEIPPLRLDIPELPTLKLPEDFGPVALRVVLPDLEPIKLSVDIPEIQPVNLRLLLPDIPPVKVEIAGVSNGQLQALSVATVRANELVLGSAIPNVGDQPAVQPKAQPTSVATDRSEQPAAESGGDTIFNVAGPLIGYVSQQPGESMDDFTDRIVAKLRSRQFMTTGSTSLKGFE